MSDRAKVHLLFEHGPGVGAGHRRRMEALAAALRRRGACVRLGSLQTSAAASSSDLRAPTPVAGADVVIVDAYGVDAGREGCPSTVVVAVDDLGRDLDVDLVVRPAPQPSAVIRRSRELTGFEYALLDSAIEESDHVLVSRDVLVTFGASDTVGHGAGVVDALVDAAPGLGVAHAPGTWSARSEIPAVEVVDAPDGLVGELSASRVVVCAAGVTMLEALACARPIVVVPTAQNQRAAASGAAAAGAAIVLDEGASAAAVADAALELLGDAARMDQLIARARQTVDGRGADRVAEAILALL